MTVDMRRLILVGNGCEVLNSELGSEIDKFDIVVRLGTFELMGFEKNVGTKTDLCITAHWKLNYERLNTIPTFITFPVFKEYYDEVEISRIRREIMSIVTDNQRLNIVGFMEKDDANFIMDSYLRLGDVGLDFDNLNPSLGHRAIQLMLKKYSD